MAALEVTAPGPPDSAWRAAIATLPAWDLPSDASVVVVSPHPDDETLGLGGTLQRLVAGHANIDLVAVTDGEASHPHVPDLAVRRRRELSDALGRLGVAAATRVHHLGVADGAVATSAASVHDAVTALADDETIVLGPHPDDGHADHDAAGRVTAAAARSVGATHLAYPVWAWQWHDPGATALLDGAVRVDLDDAVLARKRHALEAFRTQVTTELGPPVVPAHVRARLLRPSEVLVTSCA